MTALTVAAIAMQDQARALVRDLTANGMPVIFADLTDGQTCCWCDCPATAPDTQPCGGCAAGATAVLRIYPAAEVGDYWPVCAAHYDDCMGAVQALMASLITALPG